ncbi:MAG: hypothetical protein AMXMBFR6_10990 [Betaproteobacteria bacterium]
MVEDHQVDLSSLAQRRDFLNLATADEGRRIGLFSPATDHADGFGAGATDQLLEFVEPVFTIDRSEIDLDQCGSGPWGAALPWRLHGSGCGSGVYGGGRPAQAVSPLSY